MITTQLRNDFRRFLYNGPFVMVGRQAEAALDSARILQAWREEQSQPRTNDDDDWDLGTVRLIQEPETENYFDSYDDAHLTTSERKRLEEVIERTGNWWVASEYWNPDTQEWETADSVGMCAGYRNPCDPFENCYVVQLMEAAIEKVRNH